MVRKLKQGKAGVKRAGALRASFDLQNPSGSCNARQKPCRDKLTKAFMAVYNIPREQERREAELLEALAKLIYEFSPILDKTWVELSEQSKDLTYRPYARRVLELVKKHGGKNEKEGYGRESKKRGLK